MLVFYTPEFPYNPLMPNTNQEQPVFSISELNLMVKQLLEHNLPPLWIEGEISNLARPVSGHLYFSLKDAQCQVRCAMFRNRNQLLDFKPANGSQVLARVRVGFYEPRGEFQLIVERMEEAGDGALRREFEQLKQKLASEGLFDEEQKRDLPSLPEKIGVITSSTGAALRDVLSVLRRRFPAIPVLLYPVAVQGDKAAPEIVKALKRASKSQECDVLLLVRGGGSLEDLWAFNEEVVARAIADCEIPVVCGVGHEVDFSIADFVADARAATPSAAAELVSPDQQSYLQSYDYYAERLTQLVSDNIRYRGEQLNWLTKRLDQQHPLSRLAQYGLRLDELVIRQQRAWHSSRRHLQVRLDHLLHRLGLYTPKRQLQNQRQLLLQQVERLQNSVNHQLQQQRQHLSSLSHNLHIMSPLQTLSRGYAIVTQENQSRNLTDVSTLKIGERLQTRLYRGQIISTVEKIIKE